MNNLNVIMPEQVEKTLICQQKSTVQSNHTRNMGCWSRKQQQKYIIFLSIHRKLLQSRQQRKNNKIFKMMAQFVGSRDGIQCRSHHIKQMRTHKQIKKIIETYKQLQMEIEQGNEIQMVTEKFQKCQPQKLSKPRQENQEHNNIQMKNNTSYYNFNYYQENNPSDTQSIINWTFFSHFPCYNSYSLPYMYFI